MEIADKQDACHPHYRLPNSPESWSRASVCFKVGSIVGDRSLTMLSPFSEHDLRSDSTPQVYERGQDLYEFDGVFDLIRRGDRLQARVRGSQKPYYDVSFKIAAGAIASSSCTCPYDWGGLCKHEVAVGLTILHKPDSIVDLPTLDELLQSLDSHQYPSLLQFLADRYPTLAEDIEDFLRSERPPVQLSTQELSNYRRRLCALFDRTREELQYGYVEEDILSEPLLEFLNDVKPSLEAGNISAAVQLLATITQEYFEYYDDLAEYGGESSEFEEQADRLWAEAILWDETAVDAEFREQLSIWIDSYPHVDFWLTSQALERGWSASWLQRALAGEEYEDAQAVFLDEPEELMEVRLRVLERQNRIEEYLNLARAEKRTEAYVTMLVRLDRVDEAIFTALQQVETKEEANTISRVLAQKGELEAALAIARHGLELPVGTVYTERSATSHHFKQVQTALTGWVQQLGEELGEDEYVLEAKIQRFEVNPALATYQEIEGACGEDWPQVKRKLLAGLERQEEYPHGEAMIQVFLYEEDIDRAIAVAEPMLQGLTYGLRSRSSWLTPLLEQAAAQRPQWVLDWAPLKIHNILNSGRSGDYDLAVTLLEYCQTAFATLEDMEGWDAYIAEVKSAHDRKRKFMGLVTQAGL